MADQGRSGSGSDAGPSRNGKNGSQKKDSDDEIDYVIIQRPSQDRKESSQKKDCIYVQDYDSDEFQIVEVERNHSLSEPIMEPEPEPCCEKCFMIQSNLPKIKVPEKEAFGSYANSANRNQDKEENFCEDCTCTKNQKLCIVCQEINLSCLGSCYCCEGYRNVIKRKATLEEMERRRNKIKEIKEKSASGEDDGACSHIESFDIKFRCQICSVYGRPRDGDCLCCEICKEFFAEVVDEKPDSITVCICSINPPTCQKCKCKFYGKTCVDCRNSSFECPGTCPCCEGFRRQKKIEKGASGFR